MKTLAYESLSPDERQEAEKLAQQLIREVTETAEPPRFIRPTFAASVPYMRPDKLVAALVYATKQKCWGYGHKGKWNLRTREAWWGDVVFQDGPHLKQVGSPNPLDSGQSALTYVKRVIYQTRAMTKVPSEALPLDYANLQRIEVCPQPEAQEVIGFSKRSIQDLARRFGQMIPDIIAGCLVDQIGLAKAILMNDDSDRRSVKRATAFLLANGTRDFDFSSKPHFLWCELEKA